jgi:hypothetical protein
MCEARDDLEAALSRMVHDLEPSLLRGDDAKILVGFFSRLERMALAGKALCAHRVSLTGVFEQEGHRHAGEWLAAQTGEPLGGALSLLEAAENLSKLPEAEEAFRSGELSAAQARELAGAAVMDPSVTKELLETARAEGFENLRRRCNQLKAAKVSKEDEDAQTRRVHAQRRLRAWTEQDGTFRLDARLTKQAGARLFAGLKDEADKIFEDARRSGAKERPEAYLADALVALVTRSSKDEAGTSRPKALAHLRVDITALRRGNTAPGEICEIEGVGPVSVATARELLGDSIAKLLITSATDVYSICNLGRAVPARLYSALVERDRCCVVPGCSSTRNLEIDHRLVPFAQGGATELANLARLCHYHHFLKTHDGYCLEGGPGAWIWVHPDGTRHGPGASPPRDRTAPPGTDPPPTGQPDAGDGPERAYEQGDEPHQPAAAEQPAAAGPQRPPEPEQPSLFGGTGDGADRRSADGSSHAA